MKSGTDPIFRRPLSFRSIACLIALAWACLCAAQDLPDPGRRLSDEEQKADPAKKAPGQAKPPRRSERELQACRNARIYYQNACGAPGSERSYSSTCAEAYAMYRQSCP